MVISRKPKQDKVDVNALIHKGGSIATDEPRKGATATVNLHLPADTLEKIDRLVAARKIRTPRHTWLLEAVYEKLEREEQEQG